ncbi:GTP-binding protein YsxC [Alkalihalobacillus alcalophilus ATCC 27647 = CGMCC 1.3604]|uniref:Probable GTP-binding protein EngB n=1 Tax=Alkalihalobacillus alcalophilus ATCC 27647 = CGMCC 1.3604 TaxID=1218173 RepID=A0A094XH25_ALKAL|nr:ribosome biogenesis GTP-binding protein YihA/YsxC [Alkalihalobacillus alcalophilus]KGA98095.1 GTP-binding protein [Alkalihalobacillus alcalophilus ATCC 27647 = CGMCC 1.3604]MED1561432.1 ribosome biogenesis GTP-binding protein YihA/YsxC [Alkalihalobacillus alcalophilus]THG90706.1 GTP-binding protein YsxC [Alkalihalobacillus alcalophilus ATCC 27647 = CGMCC 1.3604]
MKVTNVELATVAVKPEQYPNTQLPEVALAGRSNVGKSSFINKMINRKALARTSGRPGKTQTLNFYMVNEMVYFVDVPGYGFAKVSKSEREAWGRMIETYLQSREPLKAVIQLIDIRHKPSQDDKLMYEWLKHFEIPVIIVATKSDKIPKGKWQKHQKVIEKELNKHPEDPVVLFSSETGNGKEEAWRKILHYIGK